MLSVDEGCVTSTQLWNTEILIYQYGELMTARVASVKSAGDKAPCRAGFISVNWKCIKAELKHLLSNNCLNHIMSIK